MTPPILIYGAYGYTGRLIIEEALNKGFRPILGGRNAAKLQEVAQRFGLPFRVFSLETLEEVDAGLQGVFAVLNIAGPYSKTAVPMVKGCFRNKVHYLDVTGEWEVFEWLAGKHQEAKKNGTVILPGTGFDVVPTDCLSAFLHRQMPDALELELAFKGLGAASRGTTLTMLENLPKGGVIRKDGQLKRVPAAYRTKEFVFGNRKGMGVSIPWGDVSTAYHSTGIPNITVFMGVPPSYIHFMKATRYLGWALGSNPIQNLLSSWVKSSMDGPDEATRKKGKSFIVGQVSNQSGQKVVAKMTTPDGYQLTANTAVMCLQQLIEKSLAPGFYTPSKAFGADFILKADDVTRNLAE